VLEEGAQIVADPNQPVPMTMIGLGVVVLLVGELRPPIAMALVEGGSPHGRDALRADA
jgi:sarcosine oxidase subunit alpha